MLFDTKGITLDKKSIRCSGCRARISPSSFNVEKREIKLVQLRK